MKMQPRVPKDRLNRHNFGTQRVKQSMTVMQMQTFKDIVTAARTFDVWVGADFQHGFSDEVVNDTTFHKLVGMEYSRQRVLRGAWQFSFNRMLNVVELTLFDTANAKSEIVVPSRVHAIALYSAQDSDVPFLRMKLDEPPLIDFECRAVVVPYKQMVVNFPLAKS